METSLEPRDLVSRQQVRRRLDVSTTQIRRWEDEGRLTRVEEITDKGPRIKYAASEVEEIARTWQRSRPKSVTKVSQASYSAGEGEVCARAFEAFRARWQKSRIVIELKLPPWYVDELYEHYTSSLEDAADKRRREREARDEARAQREHDRDIARMMSRRTRRRDERRRNE